jgi:hypothetical protein
MQKVKRKQILKPVLKPFVKPSLPAGPFPGTGKKSKKAKKGKAIEVSHLAKGQWNRRMVDNLVLTDFLNTIHQMNVCPMHINIVPAQASTGGLLDVVFFVPGPQ